jgi:AAA+ ATPase superfamily predicted ATPase
MLLINPFSDYGRIVEGKRFVGRKDALRIIESRIISSSNPGNLAIIGEPRVGKSSVAHHYLMEQKKELLKKRFLPIWINLANYDRPAALYYSLIQSCIDELVEQEWFTVQMQDAANRSLQITDAWGELQRNTERFFQKISDARIRIIFILDEFDHARKLFKENPAGFQGLRELSYRPEWRVTFCTTSRRTIYDIEVQTNAISTFDGIFSKLYLRPFTSEDIDEYLQRFAEVSIPLDLQQRNELIEATGGHPYLLDILGYEVVEIFREEQRVNIDFALQKVDFLFKDYYKHLVSLLQEDKSLDYLLQILFGPIPDVKLHHVNELSRYGLIKENSQGGYTAFSSHFQSFLATICSDRELWPVWSEAETALRTLIARVLENVYGFQWFDEMEKRYPRLAIDVEGKNMFQRCREMQQQEQKRWPGRISQNLLAYTYPKELFDLVMSEWSKEAHFREIFGKDKQYWEQRAQLLTRVRNPLAHNRDSVIHEHERYIAEGYCKEIIEIFRRTQEEGLLNKRVLNTGSDTP